MRIITIFESNLEYGCNAKCAVREGFVNWSFVLLVSRG
jgi:hypothetical protein